ncbi:MAG TPA: cystathionine beta-lyase [Hellea balneolensis]|uniref:Cystathionine beta-lyase n=1 Tax=Hellea balneolensis TaxID=287478 RepID=A0A7C5R1M7_9PROT|nr:cystathionine beta-lyase [Hellea balneolensis]
MARPKIKAGTSVNPKITRSSTLLFDKADDLYNGKHRIYGRHGSEVHDALEKAFCTLEGGVACTLTPSGLAANTLSILANTKTGDHILVSDSSYGPVRNFCNNLLERFGVETEYFPPSLGGDIESYVKDNTRLIVLESPGSLSMEIQDLPAITALAQSRGITTVVDNTWSAGLVYNPLKLGADIVVHSATKYYGGHSDVLYGAVISADKKHGELVRKTAVALGNSSSPDDTYVVLRGFRSVIPRFEKQAKTALSIANELANHPKIKRVIHPARADHPDHKIWARDFSGSACLFSIVLEPCPEAEVLAFLDRLKLFAKGFSFGGYESLIIHCDPQLNRNFNPGFGGPLIRLACGLEDGEDLLADLCASLEELNLDQMA